MYDVLTQRDRKWAGHLNKFKDNILQKQIQYSQLKEGSNNRGEAKLKQKVILKRNLGFMNIPKDNWQYLSKKHCGRVNEGILLHESGVNSQN